MQSPENPQGQWAPPAQQPQYPPSYQPPIPSPAGDYQNPAVRGGRTTLKRIDVGSAFKIGAILTAMFYAIFGLFMMPLMAMMSSMAAQMGQAGQAGAMAGGGIFGYLMLVVMGAIGGGIVGALYAFLYNLVSGWVGGLEVELG